MNRQLLEYREKADDIFEANGKYACFSRSIENQKESIKKLSEFKKTILIEKKDAISKSDNELANGFASFELVTNSMTAEFEMWIALKEERFNDAWDYLIDAQNYSIQAIQAHEINAHLDKYIRRLEVIEKLLFPPQLFFSDRSIISKSSCSICQKDMQECEHLKGKFYMGEQCYEIIEKIESIKGFDIVKEPANKKCRAMTFSENGKNFDIMTHKEK